MSTKEFIQAELERLPENELGELYELIKSRGQNTKLAMTTSANC